MKWITEIKNIKPYTIDCLWNDGVVRKVDLTAFIYENAKNPKNSYAQLLDKKKFRKAKCDGTTLFWENGLKYEDEDGQIKNGPLDIAPEVLFEMTLNKRNINMMVDDF